jgi:hypothetical protein
MKTLFSFLLIFTVLIGQAQSGPTRNQRNKIRFPKDSAQVILRDSILIGKDFIAVKGYFYEQHPNENLNGAKAQLKSAKAGAIRLTQLKTGYQLTSSDPKFPVLMGFVAYLKPKNAAASTSFFMNFSPGGQLPELQLLERGDIIVFFGLKSFHGKAQTSFPLIWYKVV